MANSQSGYVFKQVRGDLFNSPDYFSLAHCVSEDLAMSKGIAVEFKAIFGRVDELKSQNVKVGDVAVLKIDDKRFVYNLVTKKAAGDKPTVEDFYSSIEAMRVHCFENSVKHLAVPMLGTGLDQLNMSTVLQALEKAFKNDNITVHMHYLL